MFKKILIANRGEIAVRIIRACKDMGIKTVAVYSTADKNSMHVKLADESICIGPGPSKQSYLNMSAIISAAEISNADAIHPGIGFLSENQLFAQIVTEHNFTFIGPSAEHINAMGDKIIAKNTAKELGMPVIEGSHGALTNIKQSIEIATKIGFPILIKAASGGGGKGMQVCYKHHTLEDQISLAQKEALANFGNAEVYMEKYLQTPRHIEFQILGDKYGKVVHFGERDCSIQRRHQKIFEEANCPIFTQQERDRIGNLICSALSKMGYVGLGTVELLYEAGAQGEEGSFYFMEMNTRVQVEHTITEEVADVDLIKEQIKVAFGEPITLNQRDICMRGHAIEFRINAEDPETFMPDPRIIEHYHAPGGIGVRVDSHAYQNYKIPPFYDSLISKLIIYGKTREETLARSRRALEEYYIAGPKTLIPLHLKLLNHPTIISGNYCIHSLEKQILPDLGIKN